MAKIETQFAQGRHIHSLSSPGGLYFPIYPLPISGQSRVISCVELRVYSPLGPRFLSRRATLHSSNTEFHFHPSKLELSELTKPFL
jgi:hypothetical protein